MLPLAMWELSTAESEDTAAECMRNRRADGGSRVYSKGTHHFLNFSKVSAAAVGFQTTTEAALESHIPHSIYNSVS